MGIVKNANCVWPRNLQQYEREGYRYKTTMGTKSEGEKTLGISHKWGREEDSARPQRLQVQWRGSSTTLRDTTTLSEKPSPTQILQCLLKDCAGWMQAQGNLTEEVHP